MHLLLSSLYKVLQFFGGVVWVYTFELISLVFCCTLKSWSVVSNLLFRETSQRYILSFKNMKTVGWKKASLSATFRVLSHLRISDLYLFGFTFLVLFCNQIPECLCRTVHFLWNWPLQFVFFASQLGKTYYCLVVLW